MHVRHILVALGGTTNRTCGRKAAAPTMIPMFLSPRISDYITRVPSLKTRKVLVEGAGAGLGIAGLAFAAGLAPIWLPLVLWIAVATIDLTTIELAPDAGRNWCKALSLFLADLAFMAGSSTEVPTQIVILPVFAVAIWMMTRSQPEEETADS